jgi:hypothetical protein
MAGGADDSDVIALDIRQVRPCRCQRRNGAALGVAARNTDGLVALCASEPQPLDRVGSMGVLGAACVPLEGTADGHTLTRAEEALHKAHGHAKARVSYMRRCALRRLLRR